MKFRIPKSYYLFCILIALLVFQSNAKAKQQILQPEPLYEEIAQRFSQAIVKEHLAYPYIDNLISSKAWTNYLSSLDYEHVYFLESDIEKFRAKQFLLDDELQEGNINFAYEVFEILKERVRDRHEYINNLLDEGFSLKKNETWKWSRKDAPWPKTEEERDEIWRKRIKDEYLRQVITRELAEERKKEDKEEEEDSEQNEFEESPEEFIKNYYKQFLTILEDSDQESVLQRYLSAFAHAYDPHSDYMSPSTMENFKIEMKHSLVGIGALLRPEDGTAKIENLIPGGPAARDGRLKPGDKIIAVGQEDEPPESIRHWPMSKAVQKIRGKKGSKVVLVVITASDPTGSTIKTIDIIRDEVKLEDRDVQSEIREIPTESGTPLSLGIVNIPAFYANIEVKSKWSDEFKSSSYDVEVILDDMNKEGVDGILLDLRNNGGGYLPESIKMAGLFIKSGPMVQVKSKYRQDAYPDNDGSKIAYAGPLVILVNRLSASASEILAGALRDYRRAIIIGDTRTHGKGSVQTILDIGWTKKLGKLKVTSAIYYCVSGDSTQKKGISSDIIIPSAYDRKEFGEDHLPNAIEWDSIKSARYQPLMSSNKFASVVSVLKKKSMDRRESNPSFEAYIKLLERIDNLSKEEEISLHLSKRLKQAKAENELYKLQADIITSYQPEEKDEDDDDKETKRPDLVLNESLNILADLIKIQKEGLPEPVVKMEEPVKENNENSFFKWLMDIL